MWQALLYGLAASSLVDAQFSPPSYPSPWQDGSGGWASAIAKAQTLVKKMTLAEKVNVTTGVGWQGERCVGQTGGVPRLGFRSMCMQDAPLGVRFTDKNSVFPAGGTVAATWDRNLFYERGFNMGSEHRDKGVDVQLGPAVGPLGRAPAGGRGWEGFSPDPVLSGIAVAETVKGIQDAGVIACTKHFIGNEQEHFRNTISSNIDDVTMHELYLWPFADAVRAGTGSVMCSYNRVNNSWASENSYALNRLLKNELGFQGFVMSDWSAQHAGVSSAFAGLDMTMPGDTQFNSGLGYWGANLTIAVLNGTVPLWRLNDMATRIIAAWYYVGRDTSQVDINFSSWDNSTNGYLNYAAKENPGLINEHVDVQQDHGQSIREIAAKATVLLKNKGGVLPLSTDSQGSPGLLGVFGEDSVNNPDGPNACSDRGCDKGTLGIGWGSGTANYPYLVAPLDALTNEVGTANIEGISDNYDQAGIEDLADRAATSIVFVNSNSGEEYITVDGNKGDRNNLTAWGNGENLIQTVAARCANTIVVYHSPGAVIMSAWAGNTNISAILWAGMPGQESGNSITDVLFGRVNPGAKLPFTLGRDRADYGADVLYSSPTPLKAQQDFTEGKFIDYRAFDKANIAPLYEFGFGLSYTKFAYSNLKVVKSANIPPYTPNKGLTKVAPRFGAKGTASSFLFPQSNFRQLKQYIYPYLSSTNLKVASGDKNYGKPGSVPPGAQDATAQPKISAGGAPGGNPRLYDVVYTVTARITNTGTVDGDEVPQLYISLGGPKDPKVVLRNFDRLTIPAGTSKIFKAQITRRDISNWNPVKQDWVVTSFRKTVYVGSSSRKLPLKALLPAI